LTPPDKRLYNAALPDGRRLASGYRGPTPAAWKRGECNLLSLKLITGSLLNRIRRVLLIQLLLVLLTSAVFLVKSGGFQAGSAGCGGMIALANVLLLEWRRYRTDTGRVIDARQSLRVLYRSALERLLLVASLLATGLGVMGLDPIALLIGFIVGQMALLLTGTKRTD
jgi:ATP synthase protein I